MAAWPICPTWPIVRRPWSMARAQEDAGSPRRSCIEARRMTGAERQGIWDVLFVGNLVVRKTPLHAGRVGGGLQRAAHRLAMRLAAGIVFHYLNPGRPHPRPPLGRSAADLERRPGPADAGKLPAPRRQSARRREGRDLYPGLCLLGKAKRRIGTMHGDRLAA